MPCLGPDRHTGGAGLKQSAGTTMAARQLRWFMVCELLGWLMLGHWLVHSRAWTPGQAVLLGLAGILALRLLIVLTTFALSAHGGGGVPPGHRAGVAGWLAMALGEYLSFLLMFILVQPFERVWMGSDRLGHCGARRLPLLLIHGYQCNRGTWLWMRARLEAAGWTVATHNLEPVYGDIDGYAEGIARRVDEVLAATGAPQLVLVAHSMGGLACRAYLRRYGNDRVAKLVTLGSPHQGTLLAPLGLGRNAFQMRQGGTWLARLAAEDRLPGSSLSIYSHHDNYVFPPSSASHLHGARHLELGGIGHLAMVLSPVVLRQLREELESSPT